ncbi:MAG: alpha/beta fold hydrolase [Sneathiella sp.]
MIRKTQIELPDTVLAGEMSGSREDFLLLHAGGERRQVWRPVMEQLSRAGLGCVAYDQRGHGSSRAADQNNIDRFGTDVTKMLSVHPRANVIVGASLGGLAAILALADPATQSNVAGLVLVDVVPAPNPDRARRFLSDRMENPKAAAFVESVLAHGGNLLTATAKLTLPILLVRASNSNAIEEHEIEHLRSMCPQLTLHHVSHTSHLVARDAPAALAAHLINFEQSYEVRKRNQHIRRNVEEMRS